MRAQPRLLEYLVHMWDINEQAFHVGVHTLTLEIDDIYFLMGLSRRGSQVSLSEAEVVENPWTITLHITAH
jgi:hypothetical protein